ncbi:shikimate kinase [Streptococcus sp. CSL10205-OR2]|uniref:shikimate kinase n=1 Tax=Streptococcus sp. CSL10205-OR2 TaxID=2980558 RepID=UPI0021D84A41|nr:shikimate kinase [Streptococcus sp. CSL10205-OR2]MCU9533711.1 shikimate kinase [Streptococcus sp. CSL10205-OR2]
MAKFLIGFMGSGKTTLAKAWSKDAIDMDDYLEERYGRLICDYFDQGEEDLFRQRESEILQELLTTDQIIATGGGIVEKAINRELLKQAEAVIFLRLDFESLYDRLKQDSKTNRPLFLSLKKEELYHLFLKRQALYEEVATTIIEVGGRMPSQLIKDFLNQ